MAFTFQKATRTKSKLRISLVGPSGSGKTYTGLAIATHLVPGGRVALIDTERGSASKYGSGKPFDFDVLELDTFEPENYEAALEAAAKAKYDVVVIDSLSHAWMGKGGALEQVDNAAKRSQSKNTFGAWREVTPRHNSMVDAIIRFPGHVIATMRSKTEYVLEKDDRGKSVPRKIGIQPVQRDGLEYEFDVVCDLDLENNDLIIGKTRCDLLHGKIFRRAGKDIAAILTSWLDDGVDAPAPAPKVPPPAAVTETRPVSAPSGVDVDALAQAISAAKTLPELKEAANAIGRAKSKLPGPDVAHLRDLYSKAEAVIKRSAA